MRAVWLWSVLLLGACLPLAFGGAEPDAAPAEPLPLRRVLIPPDRVPVELERVRQGVLVKLPRAEFEARVRRAAEAQENRRNPPRLIEARYRATLAGNALVGTGEWKVHQRLAAGVLPVQPLNLALQKVRVQPAQAETTDAVLGDLDGKNLGLLLEQPGEHNVFLDWTARGDTGGDGVRFDLQVPAGVVSSLELQAPAGDVVTVDADTPALVSGPHPAEAPERRTWRLDFGSRAQVRFLVRRGDEQGRPGALVLAPLQTRQELGPDLLRAEFKFNLEMVRTSRREFRLECDPTLQPYEVDIAALETWDLERATKGGAPSVLTVRLREPFRGGPLVVRCLAPLSTQQPWTCPGVRLADALDQGETIVVRVPPVVRLEDWRPGQFRFTAAPPEADGWLAFSLTRSGPPAPGNGARPSARLRVQTPEVRARQVAWWQIGGTSSSLTVQVQYEVARDKVFQLPLLVPRGWQVDQVRTTPGELMRHWNVVAEKGQHRLIVDLREGLEPGATQVQLSVRLRPENASALPVRRALPLPQLLPLGAYLRDAVLGISIDPVFEAEIKTTAGTPSAEEKGPWGRQSPDYVYAARGQAVAGSLALKPRQARLRARCVSEVMIAQGRPVVLTRLSLQPEVGSRDSVIVALSAPTAALQEWKVRRGNNRLRAVQRLRAAEAAPLLAALAARTAPEAAGLLAARPPAWEVYRLHFAQPLREPVLLETTFEAPGLGAAPGERQWHIPLASVADADSLEGDVALYLGGSELVQVVAEGLREGAANTSPDAAPPWRVFRYGAQPAALTLHGRVALADRATEAVADDARLTTFVDEEGRLIHRYRFHLRHWRQRLLPVRLPAGARPVAAQADGRWVTQLRPATAADGVPVINLPVAGGAGLHQFDIVYTTDGPPWKLWTRLEAPAGAFRPWEPELPVRPAAFRHTWKLPPGVKPLWADRFHPLPGGRTDDTDLVRPDWLPRALWPGPAPLGAATPEAADHRRQFLAAAATLLRQRLEAGKECRLGDLLDRLAVDELRRQETVVVDAAALAEAGLGPDTSLGDPGAGGAPAGRWDSLGLDILPCGSALLLTTRPQLERWQAAPRGGRLAEQIPAAVAEAAVNGHDAGNRFQSLGNWLAQESGSDGRRAADGPSALWPIQLGNDWTEWEAYPGESPPSTLVVVREDLVPGLGLALGLATVLASWVLRAGSWRLRLGLLAAWLCVTGLAFWWLPGALRPLAWWPAVSALAVAGCWYVGAIAGRWARPAVPPTAAASALLALAGVAGLSSRAAAPAPLTVLIVPGPKGAPDQEAVLVPPDLITQLDDAGRLAAVDPRRAVLTAARYEGTATATGVDFQAEFTVYCLGGEPALATLPLGGVQLREALCDGAAAPLRHVPQPGPGAAQEGYTLEVKGRGPHTLQVRFSAGVASKGEDRDLKFTVPELARSRLTLTTPPPTHHLQVLGYRGALRADTPAGDTGREGCRVEVDLGRVGTIHARWYESPTPGPSAPLLVREAYLWDLRPAGSSLAAVLQFSRARGTITALTLQLPEELEVRNAGVGRLPQDDTEDAGPRLRRWAVDGTGPQRKLHLDFQRPVAGGVQVVLDLVPRRPLGPGAALPLPVPLLARTPDGGTQESFLAYRTTGLKARLVEYLGITGVQPSAFTAFWRAARMGDPGPDVTAFRFRRPGASPLARVEWQPPEDETTGLQSVDWTVGRQRADFRLAVNLDARGRTLALVEWDIPGGVTVAEVGGEEVRDWSQTGARLQVWLRRPRTACAVQLAGWKTLEGVGPPAKGGQGPAKGPAVFHLLPLRLVGHPHVDGLVRVASDGDLTLEPTGLKHLWPLPTTRPVKGAFEFGTDPGDYQGTFRVRTGGEVAEVAALTFAEVVEGNLVFHATLDCRVRQGELRTLTVRLRGWEGEVALEAAGAEQRARPGPERASRTWVLTLPPGVTDRYRCRLQGRMPLKAGTDFRMPDVSVAAAARQERWVAVAGRELRAEDPRGLQPVPEPTRTLAAWPAAAERVRRTGSAWKVQASDWQLHLVPGVAGGGAASVRVVLAEQAAAVVDGRHWAHQATYWLYHEAGTDLTLTLPDGARVETVVLDDAEVTPLQPEPNRLWLPLSGPAGAHTLRLKWSYEGDESLHRPRMDRVTPEGLGRCPVLWTVHIPAGYAPRVPQAEAEPSSAAMQDLHRAEAQYQLSSLLSERLRQNGGDTLRAQLAAVQERFYRFCRAAERRSAGHPPLEEYRQALKERNQRLALADGWDALRARAERRVQDFPGTPAPAAATSAVPAAPPTPVGDLLPHQGTPTYWEAAGQGTTLRVSLVGADEERTARAVLASVVLVGLVLCAWGLSFFPRAVAWVRFSWPEQLLLAAGLGWWLLGVSWPFLVVGVAALAGRLATVGAWLLARRRQAAAVVPTE